MIKLDILIKTVGFADGIYRVRAKGCIAAALCWADSQGELTGWTPFAYVPISSNGEGLFRFTGHRAIPDEATHVLARVVRSDLTATEEILQPLPVQHRQESHQNAVRLGVITDLHLSGKPWAVQKALRMAGEDNAVLCAGDMVNDGLPEQFALLRESIEQTLPENTPMLAVSGNHDYPLLPLPQIADGVCDYPTLLNHNPQRLKENMQPYFSRDGHLKEIMKAHRKMILLPGHTHISFNSSYGCVDVDPGRNNLYINCGSIRPTTLKPDEALQPKEWTDGNIVRLELSEKQAEIAAISIRSGQRISRGYYRFVSASNEPSTVACSGVFD